MHEAVKRPDVLEGGDEQVRSALLRDSTLVAVLVGRLWVEAKNARHREAELEKWEKAGAHVTCGLDVRCGGAER